MADSEKYHFTELLAGFDLEGNITEVEPDVAARIVRFLGEEGYVCAGGVLPGNILEEGDDVKIRRSELKILRVNAKDVVAGPYVLGVSDDDDGRYFPRGVMAYVKSAS